MTPKKLEELDFMVRFIRLAQELGGVVPIDHEKYTVAELLYIFRKVEEKE